MKRNGFFSIVLAGTAFLAASDSFASIIISQYYEGSSNDKWLELYNTDSTSVDLAANNFRIGIWSNANREGWKTDTAPSSSIVLSGTVLANSTFLIRHSSAVNPTYATANVISGSLSFNGDDSVGIWQSPDTTYALTEMQDVFGLTANTAPDTSFSRNPEATAAILADFSAAQWTQYTIAEVDSAAIGDDERLAYFTPVPEPVHYALFSALGLLAVSVVRSIRNRRALAR